MISTHYDTNQTGHLSRIFWEAKLGKPHYSSAIGAIKNCGGLFFIAIGTVFALLLGGFSSGGGATSIGSDPYGSGLPVRCCIPA